MDNPVIFIAVFGALFIVNLWSFANLYSIIDDYLFYKKNKINIVVKPGDVLLSNWKQILWNCSLFIATILLLFYWIIRPVAEICGIW